MATKHLLRHFTIAVTGDFGEQRPTEKIRQWIHCHGGTFAWEVSSKVTHLICSKEHYKKMVTMGVFLELYALRKLMSSIVKHAITLKTIKIVSFDWLEDSLLSKPLRVRPEGKYLMIAIMRTTAEIKEKKRIVRKRNINKGSKSTFSDQKSILNIQQC